MKDYETIPAADSHSSISTKDHHAGEASKFDQIIACAWWNAREADVAAEMVGRTTGDDRSYWMRRTSRLHRQTSRLFGAAQTLSGEPNPCPASIK